MLQDTIIMLPFHKHQFIPVDRTLELYFTGCNHNCPGCHNSHLSEITKENTTWIELTELVSSLEDYVSITKQVHILGGEPLLLGQEELFILTAKLKEIGFEKIILFTGYNTDEIVENPSVFLHADLFKFVYAIKTGRYIEDDSSYIDPLTGIKLASSNQIVYPCGDYK